MTAKELLLKQLQDCYSGDDEMSLMASLGDLPAEEAGWRMNKTTWTIAEILYHLYSCEIEYCKQGFGKWQDAYPRPIGDIDQMLALLANGQDHLLDCLRGCTLDDLDAPIRVQHHGRSAAHFFWIMIMHRISHAAQIRTLRRAYGSRTHYYPIS